MTWPQPSIAPAMDQEHAAALHDRRNPEHAEVVKEFQDLNARAYAEGSPASPAAATATMSPADAGKQARIAELKVHPAYLDGRHPDHRRVVSELSDLLLDAPDRTSAASPLAAMPSKPTAAPVPTAQVRIAELNQSLRGNTRFGSSERQQMVAELGELLGINGADNTAPPASE